jgi:hypothetical protein
MGRAFALCCWVLVFLSAAVLPGAASVGPDDKAGLIVQFKDGRVLTRCLPLEGADVTGADLLAHSGLEVIVDASRGMGITVCQIEGVGCAYPVDPCFCECMSGNTCAYWNYFYRDPGEAEWSYSALGALLRKVRPGSVEAWVWGNGQTPPQEELTFAAICDSPTATPAETRAQPTATPVLAMSQVTAPPPTLEFTPTTSPPTPEFTPTTSPTPAPSSSPNLEFLQSLFSYWPFRLIVIGLVAAVAYFRLRRT